MPIILTLLFLSIAGIIYMIGSKLILLQEGTIPPAQQNFPISIPEPHELRKIVKRKLHRYSFIALVIIIRIYVITSHFLKIQFKKLWKIIRTKVNKILDGRKQHHQQTKEASAFLKKISDYKKKVHYITEKIKEEEGIE